MIGSIAPKTVDPKTVRRESAGATPAPQADGPDLIVDRIDPIPFDPRPGERVRFNVVVKNVGNQSATPFDLTLSSEGQLDYTLRSKDSLAPGGKMTFKSMGPYATYDNLMWVRADVDTKNEVKETREDNNYLITSVTVQDPFPSPFPPGPPVPPYPHR